MNRPDKYQAAGHATIARRGAQIGATDKIRECLSQGEGWLKGLTRAEIMERTGLPWKTVASVVSAQAGHTGGMLSHGKKGSRRYALIESPAADKWRGRNRRSTGEFAIALPITIGRGYSWRAGW